MLFVNKFVWYRRLLISGLARINDGDVLTPVL